MRTWTADSGGCMRTDAEFLNWIADRFVNVYGESENVDFVQRLRKIALAAEAAQEPEWMQHIGEVGKPLTVEMLRQTYGENGLAALKDVFPQFFKDEAAQELRGPWGGAGPFCEFCSGRRGAHYAHCQLHPQAAQEQPMTMAERQTRETGFLVKDL